MSDTSRFREEIRTPSYLCGPDDRVGIDGVASMLQEMAWQHAGMLGFAFTEEDQAYFWVLYRVRMRFHRRPRWNQRVAMTTWPSGMHRLYAIRDLRIDDATIGGSEPERLVDISSAWIILDAENRRPVRPERMLDADVIVDDHLLELPTGRLESIAAEEASGRLAQARWHPVRPSDTDRNEHVNNARFAQWLLDGASRTVSGLTDCTLTFQREMKIGEEFCVIEDPERGIAEVWRRGNTSSTSDPECACRLHVVER